MKPLSFRNSSRIIASLLSFRDSPAEEERESYYDEDLQFSTFRSDDYRFYDHFPLKKMSHSREESYFEDSSF